MVIWAYYVSCQSSLGIDHAPVGSATHPWLETSNLTCVLFEVAMSQVRPDFSGIYLTCLAFG